MLRILEKVDIASLTSFRIGGKVRYFTVLGSENDIKEAFAFAHTHSLPLHILGHGTNTLFRGETTEALVAKMEIKGFEVEKDTGECALIRMGAGENWDECAAKTIDLHLSGIEAMSAIPGTAGATPIQNVGAYGQEIKDTLVEVKVFDTEAKIFTTLSNEQCQFAYRKSIFNTMLRGRYIITSILLKLSKQRPVVPNYPGVSKYFKERNISSPSLLEIREAIIQIRREKLPDPSVIPNAGSFFGNAFVKDDQFEKIQEQYPSIPNFPGDDGLIKIPAGWLIEQAGLKGKKIGPIRIYEKNALVLTNTGGATWEDLERAKAEIVEKVKEKFGITLKQEPEVV